MHNGTCSPSQPHFLLPRTLTSPHLSTEFQSCRPQYWHRPQRKSRELGEGGREGGKEGGREGGREGENSHQRFSEDMGNKEQSFGNIVFCFVLFLFLFFCLFVFLFL